MATASTAKVGGWQLALAGLLELAAVAAFGVALALMAIAALAPTARIAPDLSTPAGFDRGREGPGAAVSLDSLSEDLFHRASVSVGAGGDLSAAAPETTLNLVLKGVRAGGEGASAIIQTPDNLDGRFSVGDVITPGVTLAEVRDDRVILDRGGARESLLFARETLLAAVAGAADGPGASGATAPSGASAGENALATDVDSLFSTVELRPVRAEDRLIGYEISAAYDQGLLRRVGLAVGDVLVEVEGRDISTGFSVGDLFEELRGAASVDIVVTRGGNRTPITIDFAPTEG